MTIERANELFCKKCESYDDCTAPCIKWQQALNKGSETEEKGK